MNDRVRKAVDKLAENGKIPWEWQLKAVEQLPEAIIAACGTGKTLAGILLSLQKEMPTIIIAPTHNLCEQWRRDIKEADEEADIWVYQKTEETKNKELYQEEFTKWVNT